MAVMARYPDKYFDLAVVDPPYGIRQDGHMENNRSKLAKSKNYHKALWDQARPGAEYFSELRRVSKNQIIWGANNYPEHLLPSPSWLVWDKNNTGNFADCELAYTSFDTAVRKFKYTWNGMIQEDMANKQARIHPTEKPIKLYEWILNNYANEGDKILDTHGGSMSNAIACHNLGFDLVITELDVKYFNDAVKRYNLHKQQQRLFI